MRFRDLRKSLGRDWSANPEGWDDLFSPRQRDWFVACQTWLTDDCPEPDRAAARGLVELLTGVQNGMALLHLEIAELSRGAGSSLALAGGLRKSAEEHRLPLGLIRDLVEELKTGDLLKAIQRQIVSLLLVDSRAKALWPTS